MTVKVVRLEYMQTFSKIFQMGLSKIYLSIADPVFYMIGL